MSSAQIEDDTQDGSGGIDLIYGIFQGATLVFVPWYVAEAEPEPTFSEQVEGAKTWGDLKRILPEDVYETLWSEVLEEDMSSDALDIELSEPASNTLFDADKVNAHLPEDDTVEVWLPHDMLEWFPQELIDKFGTVQSWIGGDGDILDLQPEDKDKILAALKGLGYSCTEDQHLIDALSY